jgi:hypothetical protein
MSKGFGSGLEKALLEFVERELRSLDEFHEDYDTPTALISWEEREYSSGGCDTCAFNYTEVQVVYRTQVGDTEVFNYDGDLGDLIRELTN